MARKPTSYNIVCQNRKAKFRFHVLRTYECGIVLLGTEVKSLREHACSLEEAYAHLERNELWLIGFHIPLFKYGNTANHDPLRRRKLLLHARELRRIKPEVEQRGLTLVPLRVYFNDRGLAKVCIALARGKKLYDKRDDQKTRVHKREIERAMRRKR